ncbi:MULTISPECIES: hypothetical protein [Bacillus cereus group]|nr:hypothetical protein [Bacillus thuringiensis]
MKKKSTLSNIQSPTSSAKNIQSNVSQQTPSFLTEQGYTKKKNCGCNKNN